MPPTDAPESERVCAVRRRVRRDRQPRARADLDLMQCSAACWRPKTRTRARAGGGPDRWALLRRAVELRRAPARTELVVEDTIIALTRTGRDSMGTDGRPGVRLPCLRPCRLLRPADLDRTGVRRAGAGRDPWHLLPGCPEGARLSLARERQARRVRPGRPCSTCTPAPCPSSVLDGTAVR
jgi:hypothetical protein